MKEIRRTGEYNLSKQIEKSNQLLLEKDNENQANLSKTSFGDSSPYRGHPAIFVNDIVSVLAELGFQKSDKPHRYYAHLKTL